MWVDTDSSECRRIYEEGLRRRREKHYEYLRQATRRPYQPCTHDGCSECVGTGIKRDGSPCIHMISCPCPKCSPVSV